MTKPRNDYKIRGRIVTERPGSTADTVILTIIIKNEDRDVFPEIYCKKDMLPEHKEHSYLEIEGYIVNVQKRNNTKWIHKMYAERIRLASTILEEAFGVRGRFWEPSNCMFYVTGKISAISEDTRNNHTYVRYIIESPIPDTDQKTYLHIDWRKIDRHPKFNIGDEICAACKINTPKKMVGKEQRHFLNLDVFDMNKLILE